MFLLEQHTIDLCIKVDKNKIAFILMSENDEINDEVNILLDDTINKLENETVTNWIDYQQDVNNKITTMWNFVLYSEFNNEEIRRLHRELRFLRKDYNQCKEEKNDVSEKLIKLEKRVDNLIDDKKYLESRLRKEKEKRKKPSSLDLVDPDEKWYSVQKKKKPKKYKYMDVELRNRQLLNKFSNLKSINDIIKLENNDKKFDYLKNKKYKKLFNLIPSLKRINDIIGMHKVKKDIFNMICYFTHDLNNKEELNHIVITGPPGVGKSTLAQHLGNLYRKIGFLKNNKFVKARRSDLIGEYCGHTAVKTQKVIDSAEGGVLFIDEVYSLGNPGKRDVFTKECIDTINLNLTEKGDKLLVIIAGYKDDVNKCFFNYNLGLERRFPIRFDIEKYTYQELFLILKKFIVEENWKIDDKVNDKIIQKEYELFKFMGGDMMTLFKYAKENYSLRLMKTSLGNFDSNKKLSLDDFEKAVSRFKDTKKINQKEIPEFVKHLYM